MFGKKKKKGSGDDLALPNLKIYSIVSIIKTVCYCHKNRQTNRPKYRIRNRSKYMQEFSI